MDVHFVVHFIEALVIAAALCWAVQAAADLLPPPIPRVVQILIVVVFVLWLLESFTGLNGTPGRFLGPCN